MSSDNNYRAKHSQSSIRKEIMMTRAEISETEYRKTTEEINKSKSWLFTPQYS